MKITSESHLDHGLSEAHVAWLLKCFAERNEFFLTTVELPEELPPLECGLHGPLMGDEPVPESECHYERRGTRMGSSRMCSRAPRATRLVTVIAGPDGSEPCVLYTAFGGPSAPREPFDPALKSFEVLESKVFWGEHALSAQR